MTADHVTIKALGGVGILKRADLPAINTQRRQVLDLMSDGEWHGALAILQAAGGTEGLRRLRELRAIPNLIVERRRINGARAFEYRVRVIDQSQGDLFK